MKSPTSDLQTYNLMDFTIIEMTQCGRALRTLGQEAKSMEEVAGRIVRYLYHGLVDEKENKACSLVRFYKTQSFGELDNELQDFAQKMLGDIPSSADMKCLILLATAGDEPAWNFRDSSQGHKAIPLPSEEVVNEAPMVSNLIKQLGLSINMLINPDPTLLLDMTERTFNVFYVSKAHGSPFIPAQKDFVIPYGIESVLGFGGLLPSGEMFAIILFLKVPVPESVADFFKSLSLNAKLSILPFEKTIFA